jgi:hypothetical protein
VKFSRRTVDFSLKPLTAQGRADLWSGGTQLAADVYAPVNTAYQNGTLPGLIGTVGGTAAPYVMPLMAGAPELDGVEAVNGLETISGFSAAETGVINEARSIVTSPEMSELAAAHGAGESLTVNVSGRVIQYEPNLPASAMTMFDDNGFLMGPEAFSSDSENSQTILHELYRLNFSEASGGVSGELATYETEAAAAFAACAVKHMP